MTHSESSYIYFLQSQVGDRRIKIGKTVNLSFRFLHHRESTKLPLVLLGIMHGGLEREKAIHQRFAEFQLQSEHMNRAIEWFTPAPELLVYIKDNTWIPPTYKRYPRRFGVEYCRALEIEKLAYSLDMTPEELLAQAIDEFLLKRQVQLSFLD